jgi:uncharacterized protein
MGRRHLDDNEALYLPGNSGIHMFFMRFAIDCVFLGKPRVDGCQVVVAVRESLTPWRSLVFPIRGAVGTIELSSGAAKRHGIQPGRWVRLT